MSDISIGFIIKLLKNTTLVEPYDDDIIDNINSCFIDLCNENHLDHAKWMWEKWSKHIQIHKNIDWLLHTLCEEGHLNIIKWLLKICSEKGTPIDIIRYVNRLFWTACRHHNVEIADWLLDISPMDKLPNNAIYNIVELFQCCCVKNQLRLSKMFWRQWDKQIIRSMNSIFRKTCEKGSLRSIKWLWKVCLDGNRNDIIMIDQDNMFDVCCQRGDIEIIDWFCGLSNDYWYKKDATNKVINWYKT